MSLYVPELGALEGIARQTETASKLRQKGITTRLLPSARQIEAACAKHGFQELLEAGEIRCPKRLRGPKTIGKWRSKWSFAGFGRVASGY